MENLNNPVLSETDPSFANSGISDDYSLQEKRLRGARRQSAMRSLFDLNVDTISDNEAAAAFHSITKHLFPELGPDYTGYKMFGEKRAEDPRQNLINLKKVMMGDLSPMKNAKREEFDKLPEDQQIKMAEEDESSWNAFLSWAKGERGEGLLDSLLRNLGPVKGVAPDEEKEKAEYKRDLLKDFCERHPDSPMLQMLSLRGPGGLSDRGQWTLTKGLAEGHIDVPLLMSLDKKEQDAVMAGFALVRGDKLHGRILRMDVDWSTGTVGDRVQMGLYGLQQSLVNLVTDTGKMGSDIAMWFYGQSLSDQNERDAFFEAWTAQERARNAEEQPLPKGGFWGEAYQTLMENLHWAIPYGAEMGLKAAQKSFKAAKTAIGIRKAEMAADFADRVGELSVAKDWVGKVSAATDSYVKGLATVNKIEKSLATKAKFTDAALWMARSTTFSAFAEEFIRSSDDAGLSREESVFLAAAVGAINARIERIAVPGLESNLTRREIAQMGLKSLMSALKEGEAGRFIGNYLAKAVAAGGQIALEEGVIEEPLQQLTIEWGKRFASGLDEFQNTGRISALDSENIRGAFVSTFAKDINTYLNTTLEMLPAMAGYLVTSGPRQQLSQKSRESVYAKLKSQESERLRKFAKAMEKVYGERELLPYKYIGAANVLDLVRRERAEVLKVKNGEVEAAKEEVPAPETAKPQVADETAAPSAEGAESEPDWGKLNDRQKRLEANDIVSQARQIYRGGQGDVVGEIMKQCGLPLAAAETLADYFAEEDEEALFNPMNRSLIEGEASASIDENTISALPYYVKGSYKADEKGDTVTFKLKLDTDADNKWLKKGETTVVIKRMSNTFEVIDADGNRSLDEAAITAAMRDDSSFAKSWNARNPDRPWSTVEAKLRRKLVLENAKALTDSDSDSRLGIEFKDAKTGESVTVNADHLIKLGTGRLADLGGEYAGEVGDAASMWDLRHEVFHTLWTSVRSLINEDELRNIAKAFPSVDTNKDGWIEELDELIAPEFEKWASGQPVRPMLDDRFTQLQQWLGVTLGKLGLLGNEVEEVYLDEKGEVQFRPFGLRSLYDAISSGRLGSGNLGVERIKTTPAAEAPRTDNAGKTEVSKGEIPVEVSGRERAEQEQKETTAAAESESNEEPKPEAQPESKPAETKKRSAATDWDFGDRLKMRIPNKPGRVVARLKVVNIFDLLTSFAEAGTQKYQNRGDTQESKEMRARIAADPDFEQAGAPQAMLGGATIVVDKQGYPIVGNHRVDGIQQAYRGGTAARYRTRTIEEAEARGIEVDEHAAAAPILVAEVESIEDNETIRIEELGEAGNTPTMRGFNSYEEAQNDAKIIAKEGIEAGLVTKSDGSVDSAASLPAIKNFINKTGAQGMLDDNGVLTEKGQERIGAAMMALLIGTGTDERPLLKKLLSETRKLDIENEVRGIVRVAADLLRLADTRPGYDIRKDLREALAKYTAWREADEAKRAEKNLTQAQWHKKQGYKWEDFAAQQDLFLERNEVADLIAARLAESRRQRSFAQNGDETAAGQERAVRYIAEWFEKFIERASNVNTETDDMFGTPPASVGDLLRLKFSVGADSVFENPSDLENLVVTALATNSKFSVGGAYSKSKLSDEDLAERYRSSADQDAAAELVRRHDLWAYFKKRLSGVDEQDYDDLSSEVWANVFKALAGGAVKDGVKFKTLLLNQARWTGLHFIDRAGKADIATLDAEITDGEGESFKDVLADGASADQYRAQLWEQGRRSALDILEDIYEYLPDDKASLLRLRAEGLSVEEIAEKVGVPAKGIQAEIDGIFRDIRTGEYKKVRTPHPGRGTIGAGVSSQEQYDIKSSKYLNANLTRISRFYNRGRDADKRVKAIKLAFQGVSLQEIADKVGLSRTSVSLIMKRVKKDFGLILPAKIHSPEVQIDVSDDKIQKRIAELVRSLEMPETMANAVALREQGLRPDDIAKKLGIPRSNVDMRLYRARKSFGWEMPTTPVGQSIEKQDITPEEKLHKRIYELTHDVGMVSTMANVVALREQGLKPDDIAKKLGIPRNHVDMRLYRARKSFGWEMPAKSVRYSVSGLYTGSAADYEKPSLLKVGTGEGSQVYGWGLYASSERGVAEGYAKESGENGLAKSYIRNAGGNKKRAIESIDWALRILKNTSTGSESDKHEIEDLTEARKKIESGIDLGGEYVYEQTFFTNRAPGDESHLLKWYEPVSEENLNRVLDQAKKERIELPDVMDSLRDKELGEPYTGRQLYLDLQFSLEGVGPDGKPVDSSMKAASEFLARADIDGVKYPVDSYGKTVKDGDKAGWNYVSFRDDNINVDHKWVDGQAKFSVGGWLPVLRTVDDIVKYGEHPVISYRNDGTGKLELFDRQTVWDKKGVISAEKTDLDAEWRDSEDQKHLTVLQNLPSSYLIAHRSPSAQARELRDEVNRRLGEWNRGLLIGAEVEYERVADSKGDGRILPRVVKDIGRIAYEDIRKISMVECPTLGTDNPRVLSRTEYFRRGYSPSAGNYQIRLLKNAEIVAISKDRADTRRRDALYLISTEGLRRKMDDETIVTAINSLIEDCAADLDKVADKVRDMGCMSITAYDGNGLTELNLAAAEYVANKLGLPFRDGGKTAAVGLCVNADEWSVEEAKRLAAKDCHLGGVFGCCVDNGQVGFLIPDIQFKGGASLTNEANLGHDAIRELCKVAVKDVRWIREQPEYPMLLNYLSRIPRAMMSRILAGNNVGTELLGRIANIAGLDTLADRIAKENALIGESARSLIAKRKYKPSDIFGDGATVVYAGKLDTARDDPNRYLSFVDGAPEVNDFEYLTRCWREVDDAMGLAAAERLINPLIPEFAESLWRRMGNPQGPITLLSPRMTGSQNLLRRHIESAVTTAWGRSGYRNYINEVEVTFGRSNTGDIEILRINGMSPVGQMVMIDVIHGTGTLAAQIGNAIWQRFGLKSSESKIIPAALWINTGDELALTKSRLQNDPVFGKLTVSQIKNHLGYDIRNSTVYEYLAGRRGILGLEGGSREGVGSEIPSGFRSARGKVREAGAAVSEGSLGREVDDTPRFSVSRVGDLTHVVAEPHGAQKRGETIYPDAGGEISGIRFSVGAKRRLEIRELFRKHRPDVEPADVLAYIDEIDKYDNSKKEKLAIHWLITGAIEIPQDEFKLDKAIKTAERAKVDPFRYTNPEDIFLAFPQYLPKDKAIDPDTVPELKNRTELPNGIVVYDVDETLIPSGDVKAKIDAAEDPAVAKAFYDAARRRGELRPAGQLAMRKIVNSHWGRDANPWCLLQGDDKGNLTPESAHYWNHYNSLPKRVAFKEGRLLAFMATDREPIVDTDGAFDAFGNDRYVVVDEKIQEQWWDRKDRSHDGVPVEGLIPGDPLGRSGCLVVDSITGSTRLTGDLWRGNKVNGDYETWYSNGRRHQFREYRNGKLNGIEIEWSYGGGATRLARWEDNVEIGRSLLWTPEGFLLRDETYGQNGNYNGWVKAYTNGGTLVHADDWRDGKLRLSLNYSTDGDLIGFRRYIDNDNRRDVASLSIGELGDVRSLTFGLNGGQTMSAEYGLTGKINTMTIGEFGGLFRVQVRADDFGFVRTYSVHDESAGVHYSGLWDGEKYIIQTIGDKTLPDNGRQLRVEELSGAHPIVREAIEGIPAFIEDCKIEAEQVLAHDLATRLSPPAFAEDATAEDFKKVRFSAGNYGIISGDESDWTSSVLHNTPGAVGTSGGGMEKSSSLAAGSGIGRAASVGTRPAYRLGQRFAEFTRIVGDSSEAPLVDENYIGQISPAAIRDCIIAFNRDPELSDILDMVYPVAESLKVEFFADDNTEGRIAAAARGGRVVYHLPAVFSPRISDQTAAYYMLHEMIHGVTAYAIETVNGYGSDETQALVTEELREAVKELEAWYKDNKNPMRGTYAATSKYEMIAELANREARAAFRNPGIFRRIWRALCSMLGLGTGNDEQYERGIEVLSGFLLAADERLFDSYTGDVEDEMLEEAGYEVPDRGTSAAPDAIGATAEEGASEPHFSVANRKFGWDDYPELHDRVLHATSHIHMVGHDDPITDAKYEQFKALKKYDQNAAFKLATEMSKSVWAKERYIGKYLLGKHFGSEPDALEAVRHYYSPSRLEQLRGIIGTRPAKWVYVHNTDGYNTNMMPKAFATLLAEKFGGEVEGGVWKKSDERNTGASMQDRASRNFEWYGEVDTTNDPLVFIVDDVWTTGSTTVSLLEYLHEKGVKVGGIAAVAVASNTDHLKPTDEDWAKVLTKSRVGSREEASRIAGFDMSKLTGSELFAYGVKGAKGKAGLARWFERAFGLFEVPGGLFSFDPKAPKALRFSVAYPRYSEMPDDDLIVSMLVAGEVVNPGIRARNGFFRRHRRETEEMVRRAHPEIANDRGEVMQRAHLLMMRAQTEVRGVIKDLERGVSESEILKRIPKKLEPTYRRELAEQRKGGATIMGRGFKAGEELAKRFERAVSVQSGIDSDLFEEWAGVDFSETLAKVLSNRRELSEDKPKDTEPDTVTLPDPESGTGGEGSVTPVKQFRIEELEDPNRFAEYVVALAWKYWREKHGIGKDAAPWNDQLSIQFMRKTAQGLYRQLARDIVYSGARETVVRIVDEFTSTPTIQGLVSKMTRAGEIIHARHIRETKQAMCEQLDAILKNKLGAQGRFKPDKEELRRKVSAELELRARYMRHAMWLTREAAADEALRMQQRLDRITGEYDSLGRDVDQSREYRELQRNMNILREFGSLRYRTLGEIEAAVNYWQEQAKGSGEAILQAMRDREIRTLKAADILTAAVVNPNTTDRVESGPGKKINDYIVGHMGFISMLQDMVRYSKGEERARAMSIIHYIALEIQKAGDRARAEQRAHSDAFHEAVQRIYRRPFRKVMAEMNARDERFAPFMNSRGGKMVVPTKGRAMQLLVSLLQGRRPGDDYFNNVVSHGRQGQAERIAALLTAEDMNIISWLGQWYEDNRKGLSDVAEALFGMGVYSESPRYFPVKMLLEKQGLEKAEGVGWSAFPKALTPRVRNERDFDTEADIFALWMARMQEGAQWKAHAKLGLEMRGIFGRSELQEAIIANHGSKINSLVLGFITDILSGTSSADRSDSSATKASDLARGWAALSALGGNVGVMLKQTTSIPAFGFEIGLVNTATYVLSAFSPAGFEAMSKIWNSEQRKTRWDVGSSEAVANALSKRDVGLLKRMFQMSMITNKLGDVVPGLLVGQGIYRDLIEQGASEEDAMAETWMLIERTQQSSRMENQPTMQRRNKLGRIMYQFLSTQQQYLQYEARAVRELAANPNAETAKNLLRSLTINHFILTSLYFWMGELYKMLLGAEPSDDVLNDWIINCLLGPFGALFFLGFTCKLVLIRALKGSYEMHRESMLPMESYAKNILADASNIVSAILANEYGFDEIVDAAARLANDANSTFRDIRKIDKNYIRPEHYEQKEREAKRRRAEKQRKRKKGE